MSAFDPATLASIDQRRAGTTEVLNGLVDDYRSAVAARGRDVAAVELSKSLLGWVTAQPTFNRLGDAVGTIIDVLTTAVDKLAAEQETPK